MAKKNQPPSQQRDDEREEALLQRLRTLPLDGKKVHLFIDGYMCRMLSYMDTAKIFFEHILRDCDGDQPADVVSESTLKLTGTRQVDDALRQGHRDLAYEGITGRDCPNKFWLGVEVTSTNDYSLPARVTSYHAQESQQEAERKGGDACSLTPGLSLLINGGSRRLLVSDTYEGACPGYEIFGKFGLRNKFGIWDIMTKQNDFILGIADPRAASCLGMLRYANAPGEYSERDLIRIAEATGGDRKIAELAVLPLVHRTEGVYRDRALKAWNDVMEDDIVDSMWEEAKAEGKAEGIAEGKAYGIAEGIAAGEARGEARGEAKGVAETLLQQVQRKFAGISEQRKMQVRSATLEQLQDWAGRVLDAPDIDSVFGGPGPAKQQPQG